MRIWECFSVWCIVAEWWRQIWFLSIIIKKIIVIIIIIIMIISLHASQCSVWLLVEADSVSQRSKFPPSEWSPAEVRCHMIIIVDILDTVIWTLLTFLLLLYDHCCWHLYCCHMIIVDILMMTSMLMRWLVPDKEQRANIYSKDVLCFTLHNILWSLSLIADRVFLISPGFGCAADYSQTGVSRWITPQATEKANDEKRSHPHWSIKH